MAKISASLTRDCNFETLVDLGLEKRRLGRTDLEASVIGFGAMWLPDLQTKDALSLVQEAFELGINYFDTARNYKNSEEKLGLALRDIADNCIIATKTGSKTRRESSKEVAKSLKKLKTDRIDILQLHAIDDEMTLRKATSRNGVLQTCKQAKKKGLIDFVGISGHRPDVLVKAVETGEFDTVLVPLNVLTPQATGELLPAANEHDVAVVAMKPFAFKVANIVTWKYNPSLSLFSKEPELAAFLGQDDYSRVRNMLGFVISQEISTVIPGFRSPQELEFAIKAEEELAKPKPRGKERSAYTAENDLCRDCGLCLPCPHKLNIPAILRFHDLYRTHKLEAWAQKLYGGLEVKATSCDKCGLCEPKCLYGIPIRARLQEVSVSFAN